MPERVISERDIGIVCDSGDCTRQAWYINTIAATQGQYARLYCPHHTAVLLQRAAAILRDGETLSQYISTEHLFHGSDINA